jgi:nitrite reductase (NADH) small subunit
MERARTPHPIGTLADFPEGEPRVVQVGRREIGVFNVGGSLYALPNLCPHQAGPLCRAPRTTGTLRSSADEGWALEWIFDGEVVTCPWHGMEFHVPTGQCLAQREIRLRRYDVVVDAGNVSVLI